MESDNFNTRIIIVRSLKFLLFFICIFYVVVWIIKAEMFDVQLVKQVFTFYMSFFVLKITLVTRKFQNKCCIFAELNTVRLYETAE